MDNTIENKFKMFAAPVKDDEVENRILQSGIKNGKPWAKVAYYLDARAVMNRLDECFGPMNWEDSYTPIANNEKGFICTIKINCGNGVFVSKQDGAENTDVEAVKGGISDSFKRCAVKLGFGRELYELKNIFAECSLEKRNGWNLAKTKDGDFWWKAPTISSLIKTTPVAPPVKKHPDSMPVVPKEKAQPTPMSKVQQDQVLNLAKEITILCDNDQEEKELFIEEVKKEIKDATYEDGLRMYREFNNKVKELKSLKNKVKTSAV